MTSFSENLAIYIISLPWAWSRRQAMAQQCQRLGLKFYLVDAVDGNFISKYEQLRHGFNQLSPYKSRLLNAGEQGAALSHKKVYELLLRQRHKYALILEDDVELDEHLPEFLGQLEHLPLKWQICYLGYFYDTLGEPLFGKASYPIQYWQKQQLGFMSAKQSTSSYYLGKFILRPRGGFGYLITQVAARQLLEEARQSSDWGITPRPALIADRAISNCEISDIVGIVPQLVKHRAAAHAVELCINDRPPSNFSHWTLKHQLNSSAGKIVALLPFLKSAVYGLRRLIRRLRASLLYLLSLEYDRKRRDFEM